MAPLSQNTAWGANRRRRLHYPVLAINPCALMRPVACTGEVLSTPRVAVLACEA